MTIRVSLALVASLVMLSAACDQLTGEGVEAQWGLEPGFEVTESTTELPLLVVEVSCASGRDALGRVSFDVDYGAESIAITALVRRLEGGQDCQGNPPTPYHLTLKEPVGDRELVNGATSDIARRPLELTD